LAEKVHNTLRLPFSFVWQKETRPVTACEEKLLDKPMPAPTDNQVATYFAANALTWHNLYKRNDLWGEIYQRRLASLLSLVDNLNLPRDTPVADIGCGAGMAALALAQRGYYVEATDVAAEMIDLAKANAVAAAVQSRVSVNVGDIYHLPFPTGAFGLVLSIGVIPWLLAPREAIAELARIVRPGGYLLLAADNRARLAPLLDPATSPALSSVRRGFKKMLGTSDSAATLSESVRSYRHTIKEMDVFLDQAGLHRVHSETLGFGPFTFFYRRFLPKNLEVALNRGLQRLADLDWPLFRSTGAQFLVLAQKHN
jgi:SAM-dependent methyltransferase